MRFYSRLPRDSNLVSYWSPVIQSSVSPCTTQLPGEDDMEKKKGAIFNLFTIAFVHFLTATSLSLVFCLNWA